METQPGEHRSGGLKVETAIAKGERIIAEELKGLKWKEGDLPQKPKGDPNKLVIAVRLRKETTLTTQQIAQRLRMGS